MYICVAMNLYTLTYVYSIPVKIVTHNMCVYLCKHKMAHTCMHMHNYNSVKICTVHTLHVLSRNEGSCVVCVVDQGESRAISQLGV